MNIYIVIKKVIKRIQNNYKYYITARSNHTTVNLIKKDYILSKTKIDNE